MIKFRRKKDEDKAFITFLQYLVAWLLLGITELAFGIQFEVFKHMLPAIWFSAIASFVICIIIAFKRFFWRRIVLANERDEVKFAKRAYAIIFGILMVVVHFFYFSNFYSFIAALLVAILASFTLNWITEK